jgi:hypothetical protein
VSIFILTACSSPGTDTVGAVSGSAAASAAPAETGPAGIAASDTAQPAPLQPVETAQSADAPATGPTRALPNLVGKGLQVAQNRSQDAGFRKLRSHDALGRKRMQILDRDWKVCSQSPAPGRHPVEVEVDFGAVKLDERCPVADRGNLPSRPAGKVMPNLRKASAAAAAEALGADASITWRDGTGADRTVVLPSNWRVCSQQPKPGSAYDGAPVTLTVVKYGENC